MYRKLKDKGKIELWFYSVATRGGLGRYPNRVIDYPLIKMRMLFWAAWKHGVTGYLHYAYNGWKTDDPYMNPPDLLPTGDAFIVYPGKEGPVPSLRWEMSREGLEDYEYFWLLGHTIEQVKQKLGTAAARIDSSARGQEIISRMITSMTEYSKNPDKLYGIRREVAQEIIALGAAPMLLVQTKPGCADTIKPSTVEIFGAAEKGAQVTVDGRPVQVGADGGFKAEATVSSAKTAIEIVAELGGKRKVIKRTFNVVDKTSGS